MINDKPRNPRLERIVELSKTAILIIASVIFLCIYLPSSISSCNKTPNDEDIYIYNASCYCKGNVGASSVIGQSIIQTSEWFVQFDNTIMNAANLFVLQTITKTKGNYSFSIQTQGIPAYLQYYYPIEWSNILVHNFTMSMFDLYDPQGFLPEVVKNWPYVCTINYKTNGISTQVINSNSTQFCLDKTMEFMGTSFNPYMTIGYSMNPTYASACNLQYCEINYCPDMQLLTIALFCVTIMTAIYTALRVLKHIFFWVKYEKWKIPTLAISMVTPLNLGNTSVLGESSKV